MHMAREHVDGSFGHAVYEAWSHNLISNQLIKFCSLWRRCWACCLSVVSRRVLLPILTKLSLGLMKRFDQNQLCFFFSHCFDKQNRGWKLNIKLTNSFRFYLSKLLPCICVYSIWNTLTMFFSVFFYLLLQLISATDRHRQSTDHPIKFIMRRQPCSLKFKIKPGICLCFVVVS